VNQLRNVLAILAKRKMEALFLYTAMAAVEPFHRSQAKFKLIDGSNQSGKTLAAAAEMAWVLCGCHPHGGWREHGGNGLFVGLDEDHLANPMCVKLFVPGAFSLIRDEHTRLWRAVRPDPANPTQLDPYDVAYKEQWRDAPPLIPPRLCDTTKHVAWQDKAKGVPRIIKVPSTGWEVLCRSSKGDPDQGTQRDACWIDEQIENENFYYEFVRGSMRYGGRLIWSATPQTTNIQLLELRERAETGDENVHATKLLLDDNPFIPAEEKKAFFDSLSPEEREVRYHGNYAIQGRRIYPIYSPMGEHGCEPFPLPLDWTRYVVLDPGRQYCGTLFAAVDPDEKYVTIYDGFVLRNADAVRWAEKVRERQVGVRFEAFLCDSHAGKQHPMGAAKSVARQYFEALQGADVKPRQTGPMDGFFPGSGDVLGREEALLGWMHLRGAPPHTGTARLKVMRGVFPELDQQIKVAHYRQDNPDKRAHLREDALDCLEYLAHWNPPYQSPEKLDHDEGPDIWEAFKRRKKKHDNRSIVLY